MILAKLNAYVYRTNIVILQPRFRFTEIIIIVVKLFTIQLSHFEITKAVKIPFYNVFIFHMNDYLNNFMLSPQLRGRTLTLICP